MDDEYEIPGMYISKSDVQMVFEYRMRLGEEEAKQKADSLTDSQMRDIAAAFASEFFDVRDGLFSELLIDAIESVKI